MFSMLSNLGAPVAAAAAAAAAPSAPPAEPVYPNGFTLRVLNHIVLHDHHAGGKPIPLYCVYVFPPGAMGHSKQNALHFRWKRFSEFDALHKEVRKYPGRLPDLPSKWKYKLKGTPRDDGPLLEHRQTRLDGWAQALAEYYATSPSQYLRPVVMAWLNLHINADPVAHLEANVKAALDAAPPPAAPAMGGMFAPGFPFNQGPPPRPQAPPPGTQFSAAGQAPRPAPAAAASAAAPAGPNMGPLQGMMGGGGLLGMMSAMKSPNFGGNMIQGIVNHSNQQKQAAAEAEAAHVASLSPEDRATHMRAKKMLARLQSSMGWAFSNTQTGHEEHWQMQGGSMIERKVHPSRTAGMGRWKSSFRIVGQTVRLSEGIVEFALSSATPNLFHRGAPQADAADNFMIRIHVPDTAQDGGDGGQAAGDPSAPEADPEENHMLAQAQGQGQGQGAAQEGGPPGGPQAAGGGGGGGGSRFAAMRGQIGGLMGRLPGLGGGGGGGGGAGANPGPRTITIDFYGYKAAGFYLGTEMPALPMGLKFNLGAGAQLSAGEQAAYNREVNSRTFVEAPPPASIAYWPPPPRHH